MKIALITAATATEFTDAEEVNAQSVRAVGSEPQLGILSLAAVLGGSADTVQLFDLNRIYLEYVSNNRSQTNDFARIAAELIVTSQADLYGFGSICSSYPLTVRIARAVKDLSLVSIILFGGPQASVVDTETLQAFSFVDLILRGEAERNLPLLLNQLVRDRSLEEVPNLTYRCGNQVIRNPNAPLILDLDSLPLPAYHLLEDFGEMGVAMCDELSLMPQSFFEQLLGRMSPPGARLYATTNPDNPHHWLKAQYLDNEELRANKTLWSEHFTMVDNPNLPAEFIERQKRLHRGFFYRRFIEGEWLVAEGAIYRDCWSDALLYDLKDEPRGLRCPGVHQRVIAIDYGTTNPMVFLDIYDDERIFWVVREYYWDSTIEMRQKTDAEYADDLVKFIGAQRDAKVIVDPSAASFKAEMSKRGIWHIDADNDVNEGIRITSMVLNQRLVRFCRQTVPKTIREMQTYAWDAKAAQRGEEKPLKAYDHGPDAFRYFAKTEVRHWRLAWGG